MEASATTATNVAPSGLTAAEAQERRRRGEANTAVSGTSRSYATILRTNVFSFYNTILFVIGVALLALGRYSDAFISVGLGLLNAVISAVQEIRAKRKLDRLQLLDRAPVLVVRDGREVEVAPDAVVRGDVLRVRPGDQIVVDGPLLDGGRVEADESLLTGESDPVVKEPGDELRSGSLCVAGGGPPARPRRRRGELRRAAHRRGPPGHHRQDPAAAAHRVRRPAGDGADRADERRDPGAGRAGGVHPAAGRADHGRAVRAGALRAVLPHRRRLHRRRRAAIAGRGALVQQVNAVESVSNVDVVCTDKTGTLTTGRLTLDEVEPLGRRTTGPRSRPRSGRWPAAPPPRTSPPRRWPRACPGSAVDGARRGAVRLLAALVRASSPTTAPGCSARRTRWPRT